MFASIVMLSIAADSPTIAVNVPAAAVAPPITTLSIVPLSMSTLLILTSPDPFGVKSMLPLESVLIIALPLILILSTSRSPVTFAAPVIVRVVVSMVTAVDASMSIVGATSSSSVSASMSSCPSVLDFMLNAVSLNCIALSVSTNIFSPRPSMYALPSRYKSLNSSEDVPISSVLSVFGFISVELATKSCTGPSTVTGPPSPAVPSWVCPLVALKADSIASYSPSKSAALITLPSAILLAESFLVYPVPIVLPSCVSGVFDC